MMMMKVQSESNTTVNTENPTLTPTLSLMARGTAEKGRTAFLPVMLSPGLRYIEGLSKHLLVLCSVLIITSCGGGGGGGSTGNSEDSITTPSTTIAFSADSTSPGSDSVYMAQNNITGDDLTIDIKAKNISSGVYGTAFNVDFDSSKISYESYTEGSFLEQGGNSASYQVVLQSNNSGRLVVGISRQGNVSGATGSGTLITLKFKVDGSSSLSFSDNELRDSSNQAISATWYGGTVSVQ